MITIAHAHSATEEEAIEQALDAAGIAYSESLEADERGDERAVCYLAHAYAVSDADAEAARRVLLEQQTRVNGRQGRRTIRQA